MDKFTINDESGDRKYFSLLPHYILNHSTAIDQALYMQMKRYAGEKSDGLCWASKTTLIKKMKIGKKSLYKSLEYLISRGWIEYKGKKKVMTNGGEQEVDVYAVKDIWKMNLEFYQGRPERDPPSQRVSPKERKGCSERATNKNHYKQEYISETKVSDSKKIKNMKTLEPDFTENVIDYDTGEMTSPSKKKRIPRNKQALHLLKYFSTQSKKYLKFSATQTAADYQVALAALKRLDDEEVVKIIDEWFQSGKPKDRLIHFAQCFSTYNINNFKVNHD